MAIKGVDAIGEVLIRMQMDFASKVNSLEEVQLINPFKEESLE